MFHRQEVLRPGQTFGVLVWEGVHAARFVVKMNAPREGYGHYVSWPKEALEMDIAFVIEFGRKLGQSGELVAAGRPASPTRAKLVRARADNRPITDGVFTESREFPRAARPREIVRRSRQSAGCALQDAVGSIE